MATSNVAIANGALQRLGEKRIEALTQDSPNARSMNAAFERVRRAELRRYIWNFAVKRDSLPQDGTDAVWGGWNRFSLPNDFLRLLRDDESGQLLDWKIEGQHIVTADGAPLDIRYIADITDPNYFDPLFIEALECKLALVTCEEITGSTSKKESIKDDYKTAVHEARLTGAIEKEAQEFPEDEWITARR